MTVIIIVTAVACGLMGGIFYAFSTFVMKALRALPPAQGMQAMQAINITAVQPSLMLALFGTALGSAVVGVNALTRLNDPAAWWGLAGAGLYLLGVLVLTAVYHVPRNNGLAVIDPGATEAPDHWARYAADWTAWNHVRTVPPLLAAVAFAIAARLS